MTPSASHTTVDAIADLRPSLDGELHLPGDAAWDDARRAWAVNIDQRPLAVVRARSVADVITTIRFARSRGLRVAPQSTGHNAGPLGDLSRSVLLRTDLMRAVRIDPVTRTAKVEAGAQWQDVTAAAAAHGLVALAGSAADVGVVGYTLGGGLSWLARSHGLAAGSLLRAQVVTAEGSVRTVDDTDGADLFAALKGGGGSYAVVTALELRLFPLTDLVAGALFWPLERAHEVLTAWRDWAAQAPESVTSLGRMLRVPPLPEVPEPLRGRAFVVVEAAIQEDDATAAALLAPLRSLVPELDTAARIPAAALAALHMDPPGPVPSRGQGALLDHLDDDVLGALVAAFEGPGAAVLSAEVRHLGGAVAPDLPTPFAFFAVGMAPTPEVELVVIAGVDACIDALGRARSARTFANFAERRTAPEQLFGERLETLRAVKHAYDPDDTIHANHTV